MGNTATLAICKVCGTEIGLRYPAWFKKWSGRCRRCYLADPRHLNEEGEPTELRLAVCKDCGAENGYRRPSYFTTWSGHCRQCSYRHRRKPPQRTILRVKRRCEHCGVTVERHPNRFGQRCFCSPKCWTGYWAKRRDPEAERRGRYRLRCTECGVVKAYSPSFTPKWAHLKSGSFLCIKCRVKWSTCELDGCEKRFHRYPSHNNRFCGQEHANASRRAPRTVKKCQMCGGQVEITKRRAALNPSYGRYCSMSCRAKGSRRSVTRQCDWCDCEFTAPRRRKRRFCSTDCFARWRENNNDRLSRSRDSRKRILQAWNAGVRGPKHLAEASGASLKTVYKVLRTEGREIGSDSQPAAA
jgi:hypothetical protein